MRLGNGLWGALALVVAAVLVGCGGSSPLGEGRVKEFNDFVLAGDLDDAWSMLDEASASHHTPEDFPPDFDAYGTASGLTYEHFVLSFTGISEIREFSGLGWYCFGREDGQVLVVTLSEARAPGTVRLINDWAYIEAHPGPISDTNPELAAGKPIQKVLVDGVQAPGGWDATSGLPRMALRFFPGPHTVEVSFDSGAVSRFTVNHQDEVNLHSGTGELLFRETDRERHPPERRVETNCGLP